MWDDACRNTLIKIKEYLLKPPVLTAPILRKSLIFYITAHKQSLGALLAQVNDEGKENVLYYLSRTLVGAELNYSPIKNTCLAVIFATKKLRHYILTYIIWLISHDDPLKYIMTKPVLSRRLGKWALLLSEFEIAYIPQKAVKWPTLVDFLVDHPILAK